MFISLQNLKIRFVKLTGAFKRLHTFYHPATISDLKSLNSPGEIQRSNSMKLTCLDWTSSNLAQPDRNNIISLIRIHFWSPR